MKKKNVKSLALQKKVISNFAAHANKGGTWVTICDCVVSQGPLLCGATSVFKVCAAACPTLPE